MNSDTYVQTVFDLNRQNKNHSYGGVIFQLLQIHTMYLDRQTITILDK